MSDEALTAHYLSSYSPDAVVAERIGRQRLPLFRAYLPRLEDVTEGRRLVDVGCGRGHFLALAAMRGWDVLGCELQAGSEAVGRHRGVRIIEGGDACLEALPGRFDVATLWNVLDQMPSPQAALQRIHAALAADGVLLVRVPNLAFHLALHRAWRLLRLPWPSPALFHDLAFSPSGLRALLERCGFRDVKVENSVTTEGRLRAVVGGLADLVARVSGQRCLVAPSLVALGVRRPT